MGGSPASGSPAVVALAMRTGDTWSQCSAAVWKPRLLITAGHCLFRPNSATGVDEVRVFPPGAPAVIYSNTGPQGTAPVAVTRWWVRDDFVNGGSQAPPNDIAVIELASDIGPTPFTRLATQDELTRWVQGSSAIDQVGYGLISPGTPSTTPNQVSLPAVSLTLGSNLGSIFSTAASPTQSSCPGDSGSPASRTEPDGTYLIGPISGGHSACIETAPTEFRNSAIAAITYLEIVNDALTGIGMAAIPSAPSKVEAVGTGRSTVHVTWQAATVAPDAVVAYDVRGSDGVVRCSTLQTSCDLTNLPRGSQAFTVRARNVDGEGDALPATSFSTLGVGRKHPMIAPIIGTGSDGRLRISFTTLRATSSVVVRDYRITDQKGRLVCSGKPPNAFDTSLSCLGPKEPGRYRVRIVAVTSEGKTKASPYSAWFRVG